MWSCTRTSHGDAQMQDQDVRAVRVTELLGPIPRAQKRAVNCRHSPAWSPGTSSLLQVAAVAIAGVGEGLAEKEPLPTVPRTPVPPSASSPAAHRSIIHLEHQENGTAVLCQSPNQFPCVITGRRGVSLPAVAVPAGGRELFRHDARLYPDPAARSLSRCPSLSRSNRPASLRTAPRARGSAPVRAVRALLPPSVTSHAASPSGFSDWPAPRAAFPPPARDWRAGP